MKSISESAGNQAGKVCSTATAVDWAIAVCRNANSVKPYAAAAGFSTGSLSLLSIRYCLLLRQLTHCDVVTNKSENTLI